MACLVRGVQAQLRLKRPAQLMPFSRSGVGQCTLAIAMAYVSDWLPADQVTSAFGTLSAVNGLTFMVSPFIGAGVSCPVP
jgi:hypothetical protein